MHLAFDLGASKTRVKARLKVRRNDSVNPGLAPLVLIGEELTRVIRTDFTITELMPAADDLAHTLLDGRLCRAKRIAG